MTALKILKPRPAALTEIPDAVLAGPEGRRSCCAIDDLVEMVAAFGFDYRTEAEATVAAAHTTMLGIAIGTALIGVDASRSLSLIP